MGLREWLGLNKPIEQPVLKIVVPNKENEALAAQIVKLNEQNKKEIKTVAEVYHVSGVWARKLIDHPDKQSREQEKLLLGLHPYTIVTMKDWATQYIKVYGQAEFDILKASQFTGWNMVASNQKQEWVKGGVWYPPELKEEEVLQPGYMWQYTMFGKKQVPIPAGGTGTGTGAAAAPASIDLEAIKKAAFEGALEGTEAALAAWAAKMNMS